MGKIEKGIVLTLEGTPDRNENYTQARVQAASAEGAPTLPLTIPWYLRGTMGNLKKGTKVVYAVFDDETGVILSRMDGNWDGEMEERSFLLNTLGETADVKGKLEVSEKLSADQVVSRDVNLSEHKHKNLVGGSEDTDKPNKGE